MVFMFLKSDSPVTLLVFSYEIGQVAESEEIFPSLLIKSISSNLLKERRQWSTIMWFCCLSFCFSDFLTRFGDNMFYLLEMYLESCLVSIITPTDLDLDQ